MGHDEHFLRRLDRVADDHVELALTLYRDQELLAEVLSRAALPEGTERLAISLDDPREGPFVIVTRRGRFVTCLGKGMRIDDSPLPLLTKARLDAAVSKVERMRERIARSERAREDGGLTTSGRVFARMREHGLMVSREDVELLLEVRPLIAGAMTQALWSNFECVVRVRSEVLSLQMDRLKAADRDLVETYGRAAWIYGHMMVLCDHEDVAAQGRALPPDHWWVYAIAAAELGTVAHTARALWMLARHAKDVLPYIKKSAHDSSVQVVLLRELALGVTALASNKVRAEATKALRSPSQQAHTDPYYRGLEMVGVQLANAVRATLADTAEIDRVSLETGKLLVSALLDGIGQPSAEQVAAIPDPVARALWPNLGLSLLGAEQPVELELACQLPSIARMQPQDLYLPEAYVQRLPRMDVGIVADFMQRQAQFSLLGAKPAPQARAAPKVGRNDPCPCGSGKKFKRCCGG